MDLVNSLRRTYFQISSKVQNADFNVKSSGSTCVTIVISHNKVYAANVGDSRAIICSLKSNGKSFAQALTRDHKPSDPIEAKRILNKGGRIAVSKGSFK